MTTLYKTTVYYPGAKPIATDMALLKLYKTIEDTLLPDYAAGPEITDLTASGGGFTTVRRWTTLTTAQAYVDAVNNFLADYTKTVTLEEEVI